MSDYQPYSNHTRVRTPDLDAWDRPRTSSLLRRLEQVAVEASAAAGFGRAWYAARQTAWVIRQMTLQRLGPVAYGDDLTVTTWISQIGRIRANRDYEMRQTEGAPVVVAQADWVYLNRVRQAPQAIDPYIATILPPLPSSPLLVAPAPLPPAALPPHTTATHARRYEADSMGHINNAVYADWLEEAAGDALRAWDYALAAPAAAGLVPELRRITIHYLRAVQPGDDVMITTTCTGLDPRGAYIALAQEIQGSGAGTGLVRAETLYQLREYQIGLEGAQVL
jgi:medium-chain acyl-[acyl-carrier-protein] hydrolase